MRFTLLTISSLVITTVFSPAAMAGGVGLNIIGGTHSQSVYLFDSQNEKFEVTQHQPAVGLGLEVLLGDRDDDLQGVMKFSWISNSPANHEGISTPEGFTGEVNEQTQMSGRFSCDEEGNPQEFLNDFQACGLENVATASAGLQWRVWGDSDALMATVTPSIGAAVMTADSWEYLQVEVAPGIQYAFSDELFFQAEVAAQLRFRKSGSFGVTSYTGFRYMFD